MKYRFFYHYRKIDGRMSVHFRGKCMPCNEVKCLVACESKRRKIQPKLVMQGKATKVELVKGIAIIS